MDTPTRPASAALERQLFHESARFSYFQAVRLLRRHARAGGMNPQAITVRPRLALGFPETDIERIESLIVPQTQSAEDDSSGSLDDAPPVNRLLRMTVNFFGLYGVASPLPNFYTEDLLEEEREGRRSTRELLDVLHHALYPLLFDGWLKYRAQMRIVEEGDARMLDHLHAFVGLEDRSLRPRRPGVGDLLRYAGLFARKPRSAAGLRTMLSDAFAPAKVNIVSCVQTWMRIPDEQRCALGTGRHGVGMDCRVGTQVRERATLLRIELRELPQALFHELQPGHTQHERLKFLVRFYLIQPLSVVLSLGLLNDEVRATEFGGGKWSKLGCNTWLAPKPGHAVKAVSFPI